MRRGTIGSCQSAATSEIVKALLVTSLTHVNGAITGVLTFTFTFYYVPARRERGNKHCFCPSVCLSVCSSVRRVHSEYFENPKV